MHGYYWGLRGVPNVGGMHYAYSPLGFWMMISLMVLVVVAIVLLIIGMRKRQTSYQENTEALDIIKRRYAKGELSLEEFKTMKKDLQ